MEDFFDYILSLLLIFVLVCSGLIIFFLIKDPTIGYLLLYFFICLIVGGIGLVGWKVYQKRRLGQYYDLLRDIRHAEKAIYQSTKQLERHSRKAIKEQFPRIRQLYRESRKRLFKIIEIDKVLLSFEKKQFNENTYPISPVLDDTTQRTEKLQASHKRYQQNIRKIEQSKHQYLQEVQEVARFLDELNSQILALKYSSDRLEIQTKIAETIDELLIDIQTLEEIT